MVGSTTLTAPERFLLAEAGVSFIDFEHLPADTARSLYSDILDFKKIPQILEVKNHEKVTRLATALIAGFRSVRPHESTLTGKNGLAYKVLDHSVYPEDCVAFGILLHKKFNKLPRDILFYNSPELTDGVDVHNTNDGRQMHILACEILGRLSPQNDYVEALINSPDLAPASDVLTTAFHVIQWGDTPFNMLNKLDRQKRSYYLLAMKLLNELEAVMPVHAEV